MTVRSASLAIAQISSSASFQDLLTVSSGHRLILKSLRGHSYATTSKRYFSVARGGTDYVFVTYLGTADQSFGEELWVILDAGDKLRVLSAAGTIQVVASGTDLVL